METAFLLAGKVGDILSGLRIVQSYGGKQPVIVAAKYASVLTGIDWVEPVVFDGEWDDLRGAMRFAKAKFRRVINLQTYGRDFLIHNRTPSFQLDQALRGGVIDKHDRLSLVLDRPKIERNGLRTILIADHSESSPFPHRDDLVQMVRDRFGATHSVVLLSTIKVENFKDFLPIYDVADLLITIETAHLHLSAATKTPVIALAVDEPKKWPGSAYHPRFAFYCRYSEFKDRKAELIHAMEGAVNKRNPPCITPIKTAHSFAYNPSMIRHQGKLLTTYRHHADLNRWRTELAITDGENTWPIEMPAEISHQSIEDPKLFLFGGVLHLSFTVSKFDAVSPPIPCIVAYGKLTYGENKWVLKDYSQPVYGKNDWTGQEKNWLFWEQGKHLFCTYQTSPEHVVLQLAGPNVAKEYRTKTPPAPFGHPRGGTQPIPYKGMLLRFCHSQSVNDSNRGKWLYHCVAVTMESSPPFQITGVSQKPILTGNDLYVHGWKFWKKRIVFPGGVLEAGDGWDVAYGLNDSACMLAHIKESDLNL